MDKKFAKVYSYTKTYASNPLSTSGFEYEYSYLKAHRNDRVYNSSVKYRKILFYMFFEVHRTH